MAISTTSPTRARPWRHAFILLLFSLLVVVSIQYGRKIESPARSAFSRWRPQVLRLATEDIYARYSYPNPPIMALILLPFAALPPTLGAFAWFYLKLGLAVISFFWTCRLVATPGRPMPAGAQVFLALLVLRPLMGDLVHGNVNLFILFLVVTSLYLFHKSRDLSAGVLLALAIACKVTPALFVPYLLWKRAWRALAGTGIGLAVFLLIVPAGYLGFRTNMQRLGGWYHQMVEPYVFRGFVTPEHQNQSLPGLAVRMLTHSPSDSVWLGGSVYQPTEYRNVVDLDPFWVRMLVKGCMAMFALTVVLVCQTPSSERHGWRLAAEYSLVVLGMLLFSERTWKHHCVTLLLPFAVLVYHLACVPSTRARRVRLGGLLTAAVLLMLSTITGMGASWTAFGKLAEVYGAYVWACLLLVAALVVVLVRGESTELKEDGERTPEEVGLPSRCAPSSFRLEPFPSQGSPAR